MKRELQQIALITGIVIAWFTSVYFAMAAILPGWALACGLLAAMFSMVVYLVLFAAERDEGGLPLGLLITFPVVCATAGVLWWILRWLGLWSPLF